MKSPQIFEFDAAKNAANLQKHGVPLHRASQFEWDHALTWSDQRADYGESRMVAIGYIGLRLHVLVYVERSHAVRVISLRKANLREIRRYAEA